MRLATVHPLALTYSSCGNNWPARELDAHKLDLLFFDAFACPLNLAPIREGAPAHGNFRDHIEFMESLQDNGLLVDLMEAPGFEKAVEAAMPYHLLSNVDMLEHWEVDALLPHLRGQHRGIHRIHACFVRACAIAARQQGYDATAHFASLPTFSDAFSWGDYYASRILIRHLPVVDPFALSWTDLIQLRREHEMTRFRLALDEWLDKVSTTLDADPLKQRALSDELDTALREHRSALKGLSLRVKIGTLQMVVPVAASIAAANLGLVEPHTAVLWGAALSYNALFATWRSRIDLQEAERKPTVAAYLCQLGEGDR